MDTDNEMTADKNSSEAFRICCTIAAFILTWQYRFFLSDNAISALFTFLQILFTILNKAVQSKLLESLTTMLPSNVSACRKLLNTDGNMFTKYACCVKCCAIYPICESVVTTGTKIASKCCSHVEFPNHPHLVHRRPCGTVLMKEVKVGSKQFFYPFKVFCYKI